MEARPGRRTDRARDKEDKRRPQERDDEAGGTADGDGGEAQLSTGQGKGTAAAEVTGKVFFFLGGGYVRVLDFFFNVLLIIITFLFLLTLLFYYLFGIFIITFFFIGFS